MACYNVSVLVDCDYLLHGRADHIVYLPVQRLPRLLEKWNTFWW